MAIETDRERDRDRDSFDAIGCVTGRASGLWKNLSLAMPKVR